jgi:hypothetical protein
MEFTNDNETFCFELKLQDIQNNRLPIPDRANNVSMTLPNELYQSFTKDIATLSTDITIKVGEYNEDVDEDDNDDENAAVALRFEFQSELGNGSWTVKFTNGIDLHSYTGEVSQRFSIHYMQNFGKAVLNSQRADIALKEGEPIEIVCPLPIFSRCTILSNEDEEDIYPYGYIKFFLAPKIED